jgi:hypothetical protein
MKLNLGRQEQPRRLVATGEPVRELGATFGIGRQVTGGGQAREAGADDDHICVVGGHES